MLLAPGLATSGWAATSLRGEAELSYVKYDAEVDGREVFSGSTFAQKYSVAYMASNLLFRTQPRYYNLMVGYDWIGFDTKTTDLDQSANIKKSFGRLKYTGDFGYNATELPIRIRAFVNNAQPINFRYNLGSYNLVDDGLVYAIDGNGTSISSGVSFAFEPQLARNIPVQGLPRMLLEYRETANKRTDGFYRIDNKTKELAVAGLNKENNWVHYRTTTYENNLDSHDNYNQQQIQIGLVDNVGRRKWSSLTNWIEVSADGQLTNIKSQTLDRNIEEYDVNFMAIASRRKWEARTAMNYNRLLDYQTLTETARVPVYVKGIYGNDTSWYVSLTANRGREQYLAAKTINPFYTNAISLGLTTFSRSSFTLSPSIQMQSSKSSGGIDTYSLDLNLLTTSTRRFSDTVGLSGSVSYRQMDDGLNNAQSKTWSNVINLNSSYHPDYKSSYKLADRIETGSGSGYIEPNRLGNGTKNSVKVGNYLRNYLLAAASWTPTAKFSTSVDATYDIFRDNSASDSDELNITYRAAYDNKESYYRFDSQYRRKLSGFDAGGFSMKNTAEVQYRPDRYNDGLLRLTNESSRVNKMDSNRTELLQRYVYNFFSSGGVVRRLAALTEECSYVSAGYNGTKLSTQYLMLHGRYNPTERVSLYGSTKYENSSTGSVVMYYTAGMSAEFKLLSTSLDYTYAKRDSDNRLEKKLAATVKRTF